MQDKGGGPMRPLQRKRWTSTATDGPPLEAHGVNSGGAPEMAQVARRPRRTKMEMTLRFYPETLAVLRATARERRVPICDLAERLIRTGLQGSAARQVEETALPLVAEAVRVALEERARATEDRLAKLLVRGILASDTTRRLLFACQKSIRIAGDDH